jgi:hypothetical protein
MRLKLSIASIAGITKMTAVQTRIGALYGRPLRTITFIAVLRKGGKMRLIDEEKIINIVAYECGEWSGLAKEIEKQIRALPTAELPDTNVGDIISRQAVLNECLKLTEARRNWETEEGQAEIRGIDAVMCALHDLPSAQPETEERIPETEQNVSNGELISKKAAIDEFYMDTCDTDRVAWAETVLKRVPSAERKGHWIYGEDEYGIDGYHCDECGFFVLWDYAHKFINFIEDYHYCPNCGADMRGEQ